ncbi:MAG: amidohydrolase family protein [Saprospiraceae bacterium]|nr:amidohydrolase family protein [Saprospiraceae bacterium]MDZ4705175.1 amidohydrolase family protein [Saprospiraceae bacterium]
MQNYMVEAGMPAIEAILFATVPTSMLIGMNDKLGTTEAKKIADIVALEGDPLVKIETMLNVRIVMKNGVVYKNK